MTTTTTTDAAQIPTSFGHELRACRRCRLVKTYDQFRDTGCENCPFFKMHEDSDIVADCTTGTFNGIITVIEPSRSWAAKWLRFGKFVPCCYTLDVSETLSDEIPLGKIKNWDFLFVYDWQFRVAKWAGRVSQLTNKFF